MKLRIPIGWQVECLYTNGSAIVQDTLVRLDDATSEIAQLIKDNFPNNEFIHSSLPLTVVLIKKNTLNAQRMCYTHDKGTVSVGPRCRFPHGATIAFGCKHWPKQLAESPVQEAVNPRDESYKPYHIYHATDARFMFSELEQQPREFVGIVHAHTLQRAFELSQNDINAAWAAKGFRSTSVGDIIEEDHVCYLVVGKGFKMLPDVKYSEEGILISEFDLQKYEQAILADLSAERSTDED